MRVLVTGAGGFVGKYLISQLQNSGHKVYAGGIMPGAFEKGKQIELLKFDIRDAAVMGSIVKEVQPEGIIHLAAQSMVAKSWNYPVETLMVNTIGTVNLMHAVISHTPNCKIINIGTSEEYGLSGKKGIALSETSECLPQNPYATSKLGASLIAEQFARRHHLNFVHVRPFNHFGPGQQEGYVISDFASQIARIEKGMISPVIHVGDLSTQRDFTDVRDVVKAYRLLLEKPVKNGIYNVCSGVPRKGYDILNTLLAMATCPIRVEVDKTKFRPSEVPLFYGSYEKIKQAVGWKPEREFRQTLKETLDWWRYHYEIFTNKNQLGSMLNL